MDLLRQAAQQALEAYDQHDPLGVVMADLRVALAQPEQLVVGGDDLPTLTKWAPQRNPLTDEQK